METATLLSQPSVMEKAMNTQNRIVTDTTETWTGETFHSKRVRHVRECVGKMWVHFNKCFIVALMTLNIFYLFQAFEQQSSTSHSRHALRQHAQPSAAVSTLFAFTSLSVSCSVVRHCHCSSEIYSRAVSVVSRLIVAISETDECVSNNWRSNTVLYLGLREYLVIFL
jgi:hypothetical protein